MKHALLAVLFLLSIAPARATDVGVSVTVGQPGFYGHIDIGDFPRPRLMYRDPVIVVHEHADPHPVYMHVPPGHAKNWAKHCHKYGACEQRVYFVDDDWYEQVYVPEYQRRHGPPGHTGKKGKGKGKPDHR